MPFEIPFGLFGSVRIDPTHPAVVIATGLVLGLSLAFFVTSWPVFNRITLADRIAPYLRDQPRIAALFAETEPADAGVRGILTSWLNRGGSWLTSRLTTNAGITARLDRLGPGETIERFRAHQLLLIAGGFGAGALLAAFVSVSRGPHPTIILGCLIFGAVAGHLLNDWWLSHRVRQREARILAEFPTIAELLALSITAGEGTVDALDRACRATEGELSRELAYTLAEARTGTPLVEALDHLGKRTGIQSIAQFVDGMAVAIARGTPLSEVLRAQATDVRDEGRRQLMELSGKKEVGMLVPVVIFVLPITVLFAIFPSLAVLNLSY